MAKPQLENGYVKISNELLEAFAKIKIPAEARQILDVIIRKTYGFNKKEDAISLSQFSKYTGVGTAHVARAVNKLVQMNIINKNITQYITIYSIQKDYKKWNPSTTAKYGTTNAGTTKNGSESTAKYGAKVLPNTADTKDIFTKDKERKGDLKKSPKEYKPKKPWPDTGFSL